MNKTLTSGIRGPAISFYFHLEQTDIILLGMRILVQFFGLRVGIENFRIKGGGIEFLVFKILRGLATV